MRFFVLLSAVVAAAVAEADPALLYGNYGYGLGLGLGYSAYGYGGLYGYGLAKSAPCVNAANVPVPCAGGHFIGKREAEAEADPAVLYSNFGYGAYPYAHGAYGYAGLYAGAYSGLKSAPCVNAANVPVPCAAGAVHYIGKREAEAEPEAEADAAVLYSSYGYPYGYAATGLAYNYGLPAVHTVAAAPAVTSTYTVAAAPAVVAAAPAVTATYAAAPAVAAVHANAYLGHAVAATPFGYTHSSNVGICTNYLGAQVAC